MDPPEPIRDTSLYDVETISTVADHHDPLRDVGDWPRVLCGWVIAVCAVLLALFAALSFIVMVVQALRGDWKIVGDLAITALILGPLLAAPLFWLARRLLRGGHSANGATVLPLWLIQVMGVVVIAGSPLSAYLSAFDPKFPIKPPFLWEVIVGGPVVGFMMIVTPWLSRRRLKARQTADNAATEGQSAGDE